MSHTRTELEGLTAKALRPIAADLGITGASRLRKDEIISAIIAAEDTDAAKREGDIAEFDEEAVYAQADQIATNTGFVAEDGVTPTTCAELWEKGLSERSNVPSELCTHGIDVTRTCSVCKATARELDRLAADVEEAHAEALTINAEHTRHEDESTIATFDDLRAHVAIVPSPQDLPEIPEPKPGVVSIELINGPVTIEPGEIEKRMAPEKYFARRTRRGVETVVVERENDGRVAYRIIDPRTGHRSPCAYSLKAHRFASRYDRVPS